MTFKRLTSPSAGDSTHFGGLDVNKFSDYLGGTDISGSETIDINTLTAFRNSKLTLRNPANTFSYTFVPSAIVAARNVTLPLLTGNDTLVAEAATQTLTNKTIAYGSNTITGLPSGSTMIEPAQIIIYIDPADSNKCKVQNSLTGATIRTSTDSSAANVTSTINTALSTDLTAGRTWKERACFKGNFTLTKVTIPSYTIIDLTGANIKQNNATNDHLFVNSDTSGGNVQIEICGGYIDGNKANQTEESVDYAIRNAIAMIKVTDLKIHDLRQENSNANGIFIDSTSSQIEINNCMIKTCAKIAIYIRSVGADVKSRARISNCYLDSPEENFLITERCEDVIFEHNNCFNSGTTGLNLCGKRAVINGNTLDTCATSMIVSGTEGDANWICSGSKITNNIITNVEQYGILLGTNDALTDVIISGNSLSPNATTTSASSTGIRLTAAKRCAISHNNITGFRRNGIMLDGFAGGWPCDQNVVNGNVIWDNGKDTGAAAESRSGIYATSDVAGHNNRNLICNNRIYDTAGTSGTQSYGISYKNTTGIFLHGNSVTGNDVGTINSISGNTSATDADNQIT